MVQYPDINSLHPGGCGFDFKCVILQHIAVIIFTGISSAIALRWMVKDPTYEESTLVQVMACCRQATTPPEPMLTMAHKASWGHNDDMAKIQIHFLEWKYLNLKQNFIEIISRASF